MNCIDILSDDVIKEYLREAGTGDASVLLEFYDTIGSTNDVCKERAEAGADDFYVVASACQTKGRGRRGRTFLSPENTGLYISFLLRPDNMPAEDSLKLTTMAAVAVTEVIETVLDQVDGSELDLPDDTGTSNGNVRRQLGIKWVNDVYLDGKKICGILTEGSFKSDHMLDYAVVGIGINVYEPEGGFAPVIRDVAAAVSNTPKKNLRARIAAELIRRLKFYYEDSGKSYVDEYRKRCIVLGRDIDVLKAGSSAVRARALDVDDDCRLLVRYEDGSEEWLMSGEISTRISSTTSN